MKCDELQLLQGPYLDSELDARTSLEVEQHLKECPECARLFAQEQELEGRLRAGLNQGPKTVELWAQIERSVAAAAPATGHPQTSPGRWRSDGWRAIVRTLVAPFQASLRPPRWAWAGLGAAWAVILLLNFSAREPDAPVRAGMQLPLASEVRFAVKQKQQLMADLAALSEPAAADKAKTVAPAPRSDRRKQALNT